MVEMEPPVISKAEVPIERYYAMVFVDDSVRFYAGFRIAESCGEAGWNG
jgi:hypothetical protein